MQAKPNYSSGSIVRTISIVAVKVVGEGVVSLVLSYVRNQDELKALGGVWSNARFRVNFDAEGMTVNMSLQSNSKYRADLKMASKDRPVVLNIGTYRYSCL